MKTRLVGIVVGLVLLGGSTWALDITQCGQRIPPHETGVLQVDLDCPLDPQFCLFNDTIACSQDSDCPRVVFHGLNG